MKVLIVSATQFEVKPLLNFLDIQSPIIGINSSNKMFSNNIVEVLITGVGMVNTAFMMGKYTNTTYDLIINCGVCGSFDKTLQLGQLVNVTEDMLSELGAEDGNNFLTYSQLNLGGTNQYNNNFNFPLSSVNELKTVKGITVNTVHGNAANIESIQKRYYPDIESMEGAAFFMSCSYYSSQCLQIRAISNYVEKRDKNKWEMELAIANLNSFIIDLILNLT